MKASQDTSVVSTSSGGLHFPSLQVLRAIAALLVVMYHTESHFVGTAWAFVYDNFFNRGHIGVDLFFVLSGFLMVYMRPQTGGVVAALRFLLRRMLRIWPSYALATLLFAWMIYYDSAAQVIKSLLFLPQSTEPSLVLGFPTLFVGWTLNYEAYFYLICAVLVLLGQSRHFLAGLAGWALFTLMVLPLAFGQSLLVPPLSVPADRYPFLYMALVTNPIVWEFIMGGVVAVLLERCQGGLVRLSMRHGQGLALLVSALFLVTFVLLDNKMEPLACGVPAALLVAGLVIRDRVGKGSVPAWLDRLGDASYCIYLLHPLAIHFVKPLLTGSEALEILGVVMVVSGTIAAALVMHHVFERPLIRAGKRFIS